MNSKEFLAILKVAEKLKCNTRHSETSTGRKESVAEHSWRLSLMALLMENEFSEIDMNKVIKMCIIHDLGEAFTGDIASFLKSEQDCQKEMDVYQQWIETFPEYQKKQFTALIEEMEQQKTTEAKLYKALDKMEAVIQHNEADISSWIPLEYELQLTYGEKEISCFPYLAEIKQEIDLWTKNKITDKNKTLQE